MKNGAEHVPPHLCWPANQTGHTELDGVALVLRACYSFWCYPVMSLMPKGMSIRYRAHHEEILLSDLRFGTAAVATQLDRPRGQQGR